MIWQIKSFDELNVMQLYKILKARSQVFVVEQEAIYLDPDDVDINSHHVFAMEDNEIAAYCRIVPKGVKYPEASIGRVITTSAFRGMGHGRELMRRALSFLDIQLKETQVRISGQAYLKNFYESFGFVQVSDEYLEDGIPHYEFFYDKENL